MSQPRFCLLILALGSLLSAGQTSAQGLEKVKIVYASRGLPFFSAFVAKEKNFYLKQGLEVELIQVAPRLAITALATNQVDYSMNIGSTMRAAISPPWPFEAERHGFRILVKASDIVQFPFVGPTANLDKIKNQREQTKRVIRAEVEALRFIRERRQESIDMIARLFKMDKEIAQKSYDFAASFFSKDGRIQPEAVKRLIALEREAGNIKDDVDVSQVADLSLAEEVQREISPGR
jgi:ABC-type nitrate/sulfonate/bicarbonate transport system substrate-binding protein